MFYILILYIKCPYREKERLRRDFRLLKKKRTPEVLSIFWAVNVLK